MIESSHDEGRLKERRVYPFCEQLTGADAYIRVVKWMSEPSVVDFNVSLGRITLVQWEQLQAAAIRAFEIAAQLDSGESG